MLSVFVYRPPRRQTTPKMESCGICSDGVQVLKLQSPYKKKGELALPLKGELRLIWF